MRFIGQYRIFGLLFRQDTACGPCFRSSSPTSSTMSRSTWHCMDVCISSEPSKCLLLQAPVGRLLPDWHLLQHLSRSPCVKHRLLAGSCILQVPCQWCWTGKAEAEATPTVIRVGPSSEWDCHEDALCCPQLSDQAFMSSPQFFATALATLLTTWPAWRLTGLEGSCSEHLRSAAGKQASWRQASFVMDTRICSCTTCRMQRQAQSMRSYHRTSPRLFRAGFESLPASA